MALSFDLKLAKAVGALTRLWRARAVPRGIPVPSTKPFLLLTGATGGIGAAMSRDFAKGDYNLLLLARSSEELNALRGEIEEMGAGIIDVLAVDLRSDGLAGLISNVLSRHNGHVEYLINNAAVGEPEDFLNSSDDEISSVLDVNIKALTSLTRCYLPQMIARGRGTILNVASIGGLSPSPYQAVYYASKAYVIHLTESLAHEVRGQGVYIASVLPGPTKTTFHEKINKRNSLYLKIFGQMEAERVARGAHRGMLTGLWPLITPGLIYTALGACMRVIPGSLMTPLMGQLYKPRKG